VQQTGMRFEHEYQRQIGTSNEIGVDAVKVFEWGCKACGNLFETRPDSN
jgi:hypothetical protein